MKYEEADLSVVRAARLLLRRRRTDEEEKEEERGTDEGGDVFSAFCVVDDDDGDAFEEEEDGVEDDDDGKKKKKKKTMWTGSEDGTIVRWQSASFTSSSVTRTTFFSSHKETVVQSGDELKFQPTHVMRGHDGAEIVSMFRSASFRVTSISRDGSVCVWNGRTMQCEEKRHVDDSQSTTRILDCVLLEMKGGLEVVVVATLDAGVTAYNAKTMKRISKVCIHSGSSGDDKNSDDDALVVNLKLGAPEGVRCDEILATFDDGDVKLINVKEEIEKQHQQLAKKQLEKEKVITAAVAAPSSTAMAETTDETDGGDADTNQNNAAQTRFAEYAGLGGGKRRRFQNMPPSTSTNASEYGALRSGDNAVVSSQTYLFRERWMMMKKKNTTMTAQSNPKSGDTINVSRSSSTSSSSGSKHDVGFSLIAFGLANGIVEVHSMDDDDDDDDDDEKEACSSSSNHRHEGAVRCLAQVKIPFVKNSDAIADELLLFASGGDDGTMKLWKVEKRKGQRSLELVAQSRHHIAPIVAILPLESNKGREQEEKIVQFMTISENGDVGILGVAAEEAGLVYHTEDDDDSKNNRGIPFRIAECKIFSRFEPDDDLCPSKLTRGVCEIILDEKMHLLRILYVSGSVKIWDTLGDEVLERELYSSSSSVEMWKQSRPSGPPEMRFAGGGKFWRVRESASLSKIESPNVNSWFREDVVPLASSNAPFLMSLANLGKIVANSLSQQSSDAATSALSVAFRVTNGRQKRNVIFSKVRVGRNNDATTVVLLDDDKCDDETSYDDFMEATIARVAVEAASSSFSSKRNSAIESIGIQELTEMQARRLFFRCVSVWSNETPCIRAASRCIAKAVLHKSGISEALRLPAPPEADEDERDEEERGDLFDRAAAKNGKSEEEEEVASFWRAFFIRKEDEAILSSSSAKIHKGVFGLFVCAVGLLSSDESTSDARIADAWKGAAIAHLLKFVAHAGDNDSTLAHSLASCILRSGIYGDDDEDDCNEDNYASVNGFNNKDWFSCVRDPNRCLEDAFKSSSFEVLTALASASPSFYVAHVMKRFREIPADSPLHATSIDALTEAVLQSSAKRWTFEPHVVSIAEMLSLCVSSNISGTLSNSGGGMQMAEISLAVQLSPTPAQAPTTPSSLRKTCKRSVVSLALMLAKRCRNVAFHEPTKRLAVGLHGAVKGGSLLAVYDLSVGQKWRTLEDDTVDNAAEKFASSAASGVSGVVEALAKETFGLGIGDLQRQSPAKSTNNLRRHSQQKSSASSSNVICSTLGAVAFDEEGHQVAAYLHERCFVYVWNVNPSWRHAFARGVVPLGTSQRMPCVPLDDLDTTNTAKQQQEQEQEQKRIKNKSIALRWKSSNELRLQHGRLDMVYRIGADY